MKKIQYKHLIIQLILFVFCSESFSQSFSGGFKVGLHGYRNQGQVTVAGPFQVKTNLDAGFDDPSYHLFGRLDWAKFYVQSEVRYSTPSISYTLYNVDPDNPAYNRYRPFDVLTYGDDAPTVDIPLTAGIKILKHIRVYAGLTPSFARKPKLQSPQMSGVNIEVVDAITRSYNSSQLYGSIGLGLDWKRFSLDYIFESSITPVSRSFILDHKIYPFRRVSDRSFIGLSYRFYPWPWNAKFN